MSTKIFNVYLWRGVGGPAHFFEEVYEWLIERKAEMRAMWQAKEADYLARAVTVLIDDVAMGKPSTWQEQGYQPTYMSHVMDDMRERRQRITTGGLRDPSVDFQFEVWVLPTPNGYILRPNTEVREWQTWFTDRPELRDFHYQNSTDKPDDVTDQEWTEREHFWETVLPSGVFADKCLTFQMDPSLYDPIRMLGPDDVLAKIPSRADRAKRVAETELINEFIAGQVQSSEDGRHSYIFQSMAWVREPKQQAEIAERATKYAPLLPEIDKSVLWSKPPKP